MSFLKRLFNKAPQKPIPAREIEAAKPAPTAAKTAQKAAPAAALEVAALEFGEPLLKLAYDESGGATQRAAQRRIAELLDANVVRIGQLPRGPKEDATVLAIAALCQQPGPFDAIAAQINDSTVWLKVAMTGNSARLRQLAAQRIEAPEELRTLAKFARESDKAAYRIARGKLDELHAAEKRTEAARAHKASVGDTIERHSYRPFDGAYVATLDHLVAEWQSLEATLPEDAQARVGAAIDRAREVIANHIRAAGAQAARESAIANAGPVRESTIADLRKLLVALLTTEGHDPAVDSSVADRLKALSERWQMTLQFKPATRDETAQLDALSRAVESTRAAIAASGPLPQQLEVAASAPSDDVYVRIKRILGASAGVLVDDVPEVVARARQLIADVDAQRFEHEASIADTERHIAQVLRKAQQALAAGRSRQAMGMRRSLESKIASLPHLPKALAERLQQLDSKLHEIDDWKRFAVTPKRSELIESMQALVGSDEDPVQLAQQIKSLQEEWKTLAKGTTDTDEDWAKFHAAAQTAYEPCKRYFEAQAQQREQNLERRKALVAKLESYELSTDWENVDWKNVANALRSARQEWRDNGPTDRAATKSLEREFDTLIDRVEQRLTAEYTANLERKQLLVKQAQRLASQADLAEAAAEVKRLQNAWRDVGLTPHREGQQLWEEFKQACDVVFEKRRNEHAERNALYEQTEAQANALCVEAEGLGERSGPELFASAARLRELREAFATIETLPPGKERSIQQRFTRAVEKFEGAIARQKTRDAQASWDALFALADRVRLAQLAGEDTNSISESVRDEVVSLKSTRKGAEAAIQRKLQASHDANANEALLRDLVIRSEIAADVATPESDQGRRREIQMQSLLQGRERATGSLREQLEASALEVISMGPVASPGYDMLVARFRRVQLSTSGQSR